MPLIVLTPTYYSLHGFLLKFKVFFLFDFFWSEEAEQRAEQHSSCGDALYGESELDREDGGGEMKKG